MRTGEWLAMDAGGGGAGAIAQRAAADRGREQKMARDAYDKARRLDWSVVRPHDANVAQGRFRQRGDRRVWQAGLEADARRHSLIGARWS